VTQDCNYNPVFPTIKSLKRI